MNLKPSWKAVITSNIEWGQLLFMLLICVSLAAFLYILVIPIVFWSLYGEGAASDRIGSLPRSIFIGEWGALVIVLLICAIGFFKNARRHDLRRAKSQLLTGLIVTGLYLLRAELLDFLFGI